MSNFVPGTEQLAPETIHTNKENNFIDLRKNLNQFERPPSCDSLKRCIPQAPFEHRKFSVDSLKANELKSQDADSVGCENNHPNGTDMFASSQILKVSDKRERSGSMNELVSPANDKNRPLSKSPEHMSDPRLDA